MNNEYERSVNMLEPFNDYRSNCMIDSHLFERYSGHIIKPPNTTSVSSIFEKTDKMTQSHAPKSKRTKMISKSKDDKFNEADSPWLFKTYQSTNCRTEDNYDKNRGVPATKRNKSPNHNRNQTSAFTKSNNVFLVNQNHPNTDSRLTFEEDSTKRPVTTSKNYPGKYTSNILNHSQWGKFTDKKKTHVKLNIANYGDINRLNHTPTSTALVNNFRISKGAPTKHVHLEDTFEILRKSFPKQITAKAFVVFDKGRTEILWAKEFKVKREIASLTKIMTFYTVILMINHFGIDANSTYQTISEDAARLGGTTCYLFANDKITLMDALFGIMLPSGNDAAQAIAENQGKMWEDSSYIPDTAIAAQNKKNVTKSMKCYEQVFVKRMNINASDLELTNTSFTNAHGLPNTRNFSTCEDLYRLIEAAMANQLFREIVKAR